MAGGIRLSLIIFSLLLCLHELHGLKKRFFKQQQRALNYIESELEEEYSSPCHLNPCRNGYSCCGGSRCMLHHLHIRRCGGRDHRIRCICPIAKKPVCCSIKGKKYQRKTFRNLCIGRCRNGIKCEPGKCRKKCRCHRKVEPVCCANKKKKKETEYPNKCLALCFNENIKECKKGRCTTTKPPCICTKELKPVCCNGKEYQNECLAYCANEQKCYEGKCLQCDCREKPNETVCCEGKEYRNLCEAHCDNAVANKCNKGPCNTGNNNGCPKNGQCKSCKGECITASEVKCTANPCLGTECDIGQECVPNYCGACTACCQPIATPPSSTTPPNVPTE